ncbi:unnamed protein product [Peronospora belbahrii]|uniref:JmjC domain-containing protein n=1 Tax=Peronospora belbahrii TaxID=622444 RepID=A0ABN8CNR4_9STRA|nr:unnamed protein product [Peronospora belbahrii]
MTSSSMSTALHRLQRDTHDFWSPPSSIRRIDASNLSPLQFYRDYVSRNVPVVLLNAMTSSRWRRAIENWPNDEHLIAKAGDRTVTVDITPNGFGDAILELSNDNEKLFIMPEERDMRLTEFLQLLKKCNEFDGVPYLSHQNDSLRDQLPVLLDEVPPAMKLAVEAFGNEPEAVNIWIGDERAVSTMHKDHYENIYCVVKGQKHFTLLPPSAVGCLYEQEFTSARYRHADSPDPDEEEHMVKNLAATQRFHEKYPQHVNWIIWSSPDKGNIPWIPVDPLNIDIEKFPLAGALKPINVVVKAEEVLYLPSLWYHRAANLCPTISVNYWHDMEFDCRYVYFNFVHDIGAAVMKMEEDELNKAANKEVREKESSV